MTISTLALVNGLLALLIVLALAAVIRLGLRVDRAVNEQSHVPAAPTPLDLHDELGLAA
jgi:hypothetical protein